MTRAELPSSPSMTPCSLVYRVGLAAHGYGSSATQVETYLTLGESTIHLREALAFLKADNTIRLHRRAGTAQPRVGPISGGGPDIRPVAAGFDGSPA